jgi:hypothetical protein
MHCEEEKTIKLKLHTDQSHETECVEASEMDFLTIIIATEKLSNLTDLRSFVFLKTLFSRSERKKNHKQILLVSFCFNKHSKAAIESDDKLHL